MPVYEVEKLDTDCDRNTIKPRFNHLYTLLRVTVLPLLFQQEGSGRSLRSLIGWL